MIYIAYNTKDNYIQSISFKKILGVSGDLAIAKVEGLPTYDKANQRLRVSNIRTATETYTEQTNKIDDEGNILVDENGEAITETVTKTRQYTTCDIVIDADTTMAKRRRIAELKRLLADTDYQAIKYAEGELTEDEYAPVKAKRKGWRDEINSIESALK